MMLLTKIVELIKEGNSGYVSSFIEKDINIFSPASLENASINQISFLEDNNFLKDRINSTNVSAIIVSKNEKIIKALKNKNISIIVVSNPRIAFAEVLNLFDNKSNPKNGIDSSAIVSKKSIIGKYCHIGANVFIGDNTIIGDNNIILPGSVILENVEIGNKNTIHPNCVIYQNSKIKNNCIINANTVIGSEGFGFIPKDGKWQKMPQIGGVILNNNVEIGTNCCIDRPSIGYTEIGEGTKLDNLIQIGHGVKIGKNCVFAAQVGIAGGAIIDDGVILAGQVGVNNRVKVGKNVIASSKCGIHCDIEDGAVISGFPAMKNKSWLKSSTIFKRLPELAKKLRQLDNQ